MPIKDDLKHYKCHKEVHAAPMARGEYDAYKDDTVSDIGDEDAENTEPGYLVVYSMGTDNEYESWSPKKAFDEGYTEIK